MDAKKVEEAVTQADEALQKVLEKRGYTLYTGSGEVTPRYMQAVAHLASSILTAEANKTA